jgi:hypothetical protein
MSVGARLGGTYEDTVCLVCFWHSYGYYRDLAGFGQEFVGWYEVNFGLYIQLNAQVRVLKRSKTFESIRKYSKPFQLYAHLIARSAEYRIQQTGDRIVIVTTSPDRHYILFVPVFVSI